jgi:hypothetical protein
MTSQPKRLPTLPEDLARFHATRAGLYHVFFELLRMPPCPSVAEAAARVLETVAGDHPAAALLRRALADIDLDTAGQEYGQLFGGPQPRVAMRCKWPNCGVRDAAFSAADTLAGGERVSEIHVLAVLAERTAQAFAAGKLAEAAAFGDVQAKFLSFHAAACLADMAEELRAARTPLYAGAGQALAALAEQDLQLLGYSGA